MNSGYLPIPLHDKPTYLPTVLNKDTRCGRHLSIPTSRSETYRFQIKPDTESSERCVRN